MPSFGEKLKQERLKRSITLEQISLSTKIGTRMLQALEENKFSQLPGGIFNKGFVRAYARYLGLDEEQTVADFLVASGEVAPEPIPEIRAEAARPPARQPAAPQPASRPLPWGLFAALLLAIALALSIWSRRQHKPEERVVAAPGATQALSSESAGKPVEPPPPISPQPEGRTVTSASALPSSQPPRTAASSSPVSAGSPPAREKPVAESVAGFSASQPDQFSVVVIAREDSWLSIMADGKTTFTETLLAGDQRAVHAHDKITLKCGNTGALEFVFNGKKLPSQGGLGEVKTLTFGVGGLEPASAAPAVEQ